MNPTAALMLARAAEEDRRRELRQRQLQQATQSTPSEERPTWLDRIRQGRLRLAGSAA